MMKKLVLLSFLILIIPAALGSEQWMYDSETIQTKVTLSSQISITPKSEKWETKEVTATLSFIPKEDYMQNLNSLTLSPLTSVQGDSATFKWNNPTEKNLTFKLTADLKNKNIIPPVLTKIHFPLTGLDSELMEYTKSRDLINSDDGRINGLATKLTKDEDDLYFAVFRIADYVMKNVEYTLDDKDISQNSKTATWVLENKKGVCDEMTTLFAAIARSVGIPVKYVSGLAYSDYRKNSGWGPHAWAEVYFPGAGWIPYDVTYKEIGFIDATHIKLKESLDADESSMEYEWKGKEIEAKTSPLSMDVDLIQKKGKLKDIVSVNATIRNQTIPFGSYTWLDAEITNLLDQYVTTEVSLSQSTEVKIYGFSRRHVAIPPNGKEIISWKLRPSKGLDPDYAYTIPIIVFTTRNVTSETSLTLRENRYTSESADIKILNITHPTTTKFNNNFDISFRLKRNSESMPTDIHVSLQAETFQQEWNLDSMDQDQKFIISLQGKSLREGTNPISIEVTFKGDDGETIRKEKSFTIDLTETTIFQRLLLRMYDLERWLIELL